MGILVGESPGRDEAELGRPFVGSTGRELDDALLSVKLQRSKLYLVNAICCRPPMKKSLTDMKKAADACRGAVLNQLRSLESTEHIFAMGKWAYYSLTGRTKGLKNGRGFVREWSLKEMQRVHEAFTEKLFLQRQKQKRWKEKDLQKVRSQKGEPAPKRE